MANPFLGVRIPVELNEAIAARMKLTGQSKSEIVIDALKSYLGILPFQHRLEEIEHRVATLEMELKSGGEAGLSKASAQSAIHPPISSGSSPEKPLEKSFGYDAEQDHAKF